MIDQILEKIIVKEVPGDQVAVLMSGGTDSCTLLFTALRLGKKVHCYTFRPNNEDTYDSLKKQKRYAKYLMFH